MNKGWINGGFFVCEPGFFDLIKDDSTILEQDPMENIAQQNALYEELVSFITSIHSEKQTLVDASAGREAIKLALLIQEKINESK